MKTKKLYEADAYQTSFEAEVIGSTSVDRRPGLILDRTLFYPTGGGQPHDTGTIDGFPVFDVLEQRGVIVHILGKTPPAGKVTGKIDWKRRFDHMQQHTGQHILSQAFVRVLNAETIGFHLGKNDATIDVAAPRLRWSDIHGIEDEANGTVFANNPVKVSEVAQETLSEIELRSATARKGTIRVVDISDYDRSACGGTHVRATGEIGLIKVLRFEKYKGDFRVTFVCGHRALSAMQAKTEAMETAARAMTLGEAQLADGIHRLLDNQKTYRKRVNALEKQLLVKEAQEHISRGRWIGEFCFVTATITDRDAKTIQALGLQITENPKTVCLLGVASDRATVIVGQSEDAPFDLKALTPVVASLLDGKGGGNHRQIQVSGADVARLAPAMAALTGHIEKQIVV